MRKTFTILIAAALMAAVLVVPGTALGRATFLEYDGVEKQIVGPILEDYADIDWTKPIVHARFTSVFEDVASDWRATGTTFVSGKLAISESIEFEVTPGVTLRFPWTANMHGTAETVVVDEADVAVGTWVSTWQGKLVDGVSYYKVVGHGTGAFAGMKMMADFAGTAVFEPIYFEGRILDPHGS